MLWLASQRSAYTGSRMAPVEIAGLQRVTHFKVLLCIWGYGVQADQREKSIGAFCRIDEHSY